MTADDYLQLATEHVPACPLCGHDERLPVTDMDRAGMPATSVMCCGCGLVYITPRMTAEGYAEFYRSGEYRRLASTVNPGTVEGRRGCQGRYAGSISKILASIEPRPTGNFLDIGGSIGSVAARLQEDYGLRGTVLEPSDEERGEAEQRGLATIPGTLDTWEPTEQYDVVGLFQTVDHLLRPSESMAKIRRMMKPDSVFLVDCVDFRFLAFGMKSLEQAVKIDHPCAFTAWNLQCLLARSGFEAIGHASWSEELKLGKEVLSRKMLFVCQPCEPQDVYPHPDLVRRLWQLIQGVKNARDQRNRGAGTVGTADGSVAARVCVPGQVALDSQCMETQQERQ